MRQNKFVLGFLIGLFGAILALIPHVTGHMESWEAKTWDWRATLMAKPGKATRDICLILLDQKSLEWSREESALSWPWPREMYSAVTNFCLRSGVKALAFDVLFEDPSGYGAEDDLRFGRALAAFGRVATAVSLFDEDGPGAHWPEGIRMPGFRITGLDQWPAYSATKRNSFKRVKMPVAEVAQNASVLGNVTQSPDPDGIYRKIEVLSLFDAQILPALGLGNYLAARPTAALQILHNKLMIDGSSIPIDPEGRAILRYRGPAGTFKTYSAAAVIQSEIQFINGETPNIDGPQEFKDKYVFFGLSAPGLYDLRSAPVAGKFPGAEIYATMLDNFLSGDFIQKAPQALSITLVFFLAMACSLSAIYFSKPSASLIISAIALPLPVLICLGAYSLGYWLPLVVQQSAVIVTIGIALIVNYATEGRQRRFIKNAFKYFLSPDVIEQLIAHPERLKLGGERKVLSIFFSDLQGFTSISEGMDPESLTELLNDYLTEMGDIIHKEGGTIDKYEGDAIIAFWNAPLDVDEHAICAAKAALRCQARLAQLQPEFKQRTGKDIRMRVGIHTGPVVVGNMGSRYRFDYTILGDAANLASRLEGANKQFGTYTMISHATRQLLSDEFAVRELARLTVVGRREPVTVYEPMFQEEYEDKKEMMETFSKGLSLFYKGEFAPALKTFLAIQEFDAPAASYAKKCRTLLETQPVDWKGVWVLDSK